MPSILNPYISFKDNARLAMEFYKTIFGGKLEMSTFGEAMPTGDAEADKNIMHMLRTDNGMTLMAADTPPGMQFQEGSSISISLSGENDTELRGYWKGLTAGGQITVPLEKAPWGDIFGMVTDKFGIKWVVNINTTQAT